ncbi:hypothetical protein EDB80DRAFT_815775 [Ilyonectria destructans]|nr:hypothetical protein EDB80DRAFT_815775 [Ilyonectria destructans]
MNRYDQPTLPTPPLLAAKYDPLVRRLFNYSQCMSASDALYGGVIRERRNLLDRLNITDFPRVTGRFDNSSASLEIRGIFGGNTLGHDDEGPMSFIGGPITISFLGVIDGNRSDTLLSSLNDTPEWNSTLGYSQTIYDEIGGYYYGRAAQALVRGSQYWTCLRQQLPVPLIRACGAWLSPRLAGVWSHHLSRLDRAQRRSWVGDAVVSCTGPRRWAALPPSTCIQQAGRYGLCGDLAF